MPMPCFIYLFVFDTGLHLCQADLAFELLTPCLHLQSPGIPGGYHQSPLGLACFSWLGWSRGSCGLCGEEGREGEYPLSIKDDIRDICHGSGLEVTLQSGSFPTAGPKIFGGEPPSKVAPVGWASGGASQRRGPVCHSVMIVSMPSFIFVHPSF